MATRNALRARQQTVVSGGGHDWMLTIATANDELLAAQTDDGNQSAELMDALRQRLREIVAEARNSEVSWGDIGTALGVPRGNAYQRFRHGTARPAPAA